MLCFSNHGIYYKTSCIYVLYVFCFCNSFGLLLFVFFFNKIIFVLIYKLGGMAELSNI